jgi:Fibronectin type III domain
MSKVSSLQHPTLPVQRYLIIAWYLILFQFIAVTCSAQCYCDNSVIKLKFDKGPIWHYDDNGKAISYSMVLDLACEDIPLKNDCDWTDGMYCYHVLIRPIGATEWNIYDYSACIYSGGLAYLFAGPFLPCVEYEVRITCPQQAEGQPSCDPTTQVEHFLNGDPNLNVTDTAMICRDLSTSGVSPIKDIYVEQIDPTTGATTLKWDYGYPVTDVPNFEYRKVLSPPAPWTPLSATTTPAYTFTSLDLCTEYEFRVTLAEDCCANSLTRKFKTGDCSAEISTITDITGNQATVHWRSNSSYTPTSYEVSWKPIVGQTQSIATNNTSYTITNLAHGTTYAVTVTPQCSAPSTCAGLPSTKSFKTSCDKYEHNDDFNNAPLIPFGAITYASISPKEDEDYFTFIPTCRIVHVTIIQPWYYNQPGITPVAHHQYQIFDQDLNLVPRQSGDVDDENGRNFYILEPGQTYFIKINKFQNTYWSPFVESYCYDFTIYSGDKGNIETGGIEGPDHVTDISQEYTYNLKSIYDWSNHELNGMVTWEISHPGVITFVYPSTTAVGVLFPAPGEYLLTATIHYCDGTSAIVNKTIKVSDACYTSGQYYNNGIIRPMYESNFIGTSQYNITLTLPEGTSSYSWNLVSGNAGYQISDQGIRVQQSSSCVTFQLVLNDGPCAGQTTTYQFCYEDHVVIGQNEFTISPNPVVDYILLKKTSYKENPGRNQRIEIAVFDQYSTLVHTSSREISNQCNIPVTGLIPGTYTLRLIYEGGVQQYSFVKM